MDEHQTWRTLRIVVLLLMLAYLGFYFYGLILGAFAPLEIVGLSIAAVGVIAAITAITLRRRFSHGSVDEIDEDDRAARRYRERRGF